MASVNITHGNPWPWHDGPGFPTWMPVSEPELKGAPPFTCKITPPLNNTVPSIPLCLSKQAIADASLECSKFKLYNHFIENNREGEAEERKLVAPSYPEEPRDVCVDYCNMINNGTVFEDLQKCWDERCVDGEKLREENKKILEFQVGVMGDGYCKPFGLLSGKDVRIGPKGDDGEDDDGEPEGDDEKDGDAKGEEGKDDAKEDDAKKDEKKEDEKKDEKDSAAAGLGVKKSVAVLALVFGSVFSGLIL